MARRAGVPNRATLERQARVFRTGAATVDVMIDAMRYYYDRARALIEKRTPRGPPIEGPLAIEIDHAFEMACNYAADAALYIHPKMSPVDYNSRFDMTRLTDDERRTLTGLLAKGLGLDDEPAANGSRETALRIEDARDPHNH